MSTGRDLRSLLQDLSKWVESIRLILREDETHKDHLSVEIPAHDDFPPESYFVSVVPLYHLHQVGRMMRELRRDWDKWQRAFEKESPNGDIMESLCAYQKIATKILSLPFLSKADLEARAQKQTQRLERRQNLKRFGRYLHNRKLSLAYRRFQEDGDV